MTFLAGTGVGAAGTYLADRFTDQRRKGEAKREADAGFLRIAKLMPKLLCEFLEDLRAENLLREFVVLRSERLQFMHDKPRIEIYETKHPQAKNQVGIGRCLSSQRHVDGETTNGHSRLHLAADPDERRAPGAPFVSRGSERFLALLTSLS